MSAFAEKLFEHKENTTKQPEKVSKINIQNIPEETSEINLKQLESQEKEQLKTVRENLQKIFNRKTEESSLDEECANPKHPENQKKNTKEISSFKKYGTRFVAGFLLAMTTCNSIYAGKTVATENNFQKEPNSISYKQNGAERRLLFEEQRMEIAESIGESQTIWEMEQYLIGNAERTGGFFVDDKGDTVIAENLIGAIQTADEDMLDVVENMQSLEDVNDMQIKLPEILKNFKKISAHLEHLMQKEAKFAFMYTHNVDLRENGEAIHSSIQQEEIYGEKMHLHTIKPEFLGYEKSNSDPIMIQPGFATTPETYKRMSIDLAMRGIQVSVIDQTTMDLDFSKKTDRFNNLPELPQAYALAAEKGIELVSNNYTEKIDVIAYSLGSIGATAAIEKNINTSIDDLVLVNPVGLYNVNDFWELKSVRGIELISDVLGKHSGQVKKESESSARAQRIHEDITSDVTNRIKGQNFSNIFNSADIFKLKASLETTNAELGPILKEVSKKVDVTIITGGQDAFSPPEEMKEQLKDVPVKIDIKPDWSHSTMKYKQGEISYMLHSVLSENTNQ